MKAIALEWISKAEGDFHTAMREYRARKFPNYDAASFHAQQCIEKYLKAVLVEQNIAFNRIHDLEVLLESCLLLFPLWESMRSDAQLLTQYAVQFRYPGDSADKREAQEAIEAMKRIRKEIREALGS